MDKDISADRQCYSKGFAAGKALGVNPLTLRSNANPDHTVHLNQVRQRDYSPDRLYQDSPKRMSNTPI